MNTMHVQIGEVKVARRGETLSAVLGSCVGVGIIWPTHKMCGLSHSLLSQSPIKSFEINAKYVSQAIPSLLNLMKVKKENMSEIYAVVAGGGNMLYQNQTSSQLNIGEQNVDVAFKILTELGIKIAHSECGGEMGRRIVIDSTSFEYRIYKIPKINEVGNL